MQLSPLCQDTAAGTFNGTLDGPVSWSFNWKAPNVGPGKITLFAAGLAADGDMTPAGDIAYSTSIATSCCKVPGDANGNGVFSGIIELTFIINYLYKGGQAPSCLEQADANGDGIVNVRDITYIINFLYKHGPNLVCP